MKSIIAGEYILQIDENGHVDVVRIFRNAMQTMKEIAASKNFTVESKWNTQDLGRHLVKEFGDGKTAKFKDIIINKLPEGKIEIYQECANTIGALRTIAEQMNFAYEEKWNTQTFGAKLAAYLEENKASADQILQTPNAKKETASTGVDNKQKTASIEPIVCSLDTIQDIRLREVMDTWHIAFMDDNMDIIPEEQLDSIKKLLEARIKALKFKTQSGEVSVSSDIEFDINQDMMDASEVFPGQGEDLVDEVELALGAILTIAKENNVNVLCQIRLDGDDHGQPAALFECAALINGIPSCFELTTYTEMDDEDETIYKDENEDELDSDTIIEYLNDNFLDNFEESPWDEDEDEELTDKGVEQQEKVYSILGKVIFPYIY